MENTPPQPPFMKGFGYTVLGNLGLLLLYSAAFWMVDHSGKGAFSVSVLVASCVHAGACLLCSLGCFIGERNDLGAGFLLSSLLVPLIGVSFCFAGIDFHIN